MTLVNPSPTSNVVEPIFFSPQTFIITKSFLAINS